jgi:ferritin-like metal-binding protein YciE
VERLEQVFESLGEKARGRKCEAMAGLVKEGGDIVSNTEIAGYGSARNHAQLPGP